MPTAINIQLTKYCLFKNLAIFVDNDHDVYVVADKSILDTYKHLPYNHPSQLSDMVLNKPSHRIYSSNKTATYFDIYAHDELVFTQKEINEIYEFLNL